MSEEVKALKDMAEKGRILYRSSQIDIKEAKAMVMPYLNAVNKRAKELATKFGMRARKVSFYSFVR